LVHIRPKDDPAARQVDEGLAEVIAPDAGKPIKEAWRRFDLGRHQFSNRKRLLSRDSPQSTKRHEQIRQRGDTADQG
jgi:hypothetical protein